MYVLAFFAAGILLIRNDAFGTRHFNTESKIIHHLTRAEMINMKLVRQVQFGFKHILRDQLKTLYPRCAVALCSQDSNLY